MRFLRINLLCMLTRGQKSLYDTMNIPSERDELILMIFRYQLYIRDESRDLKNFHECVFLATLPCDDAMQTKMWETKIAFSAAASLRFFSYLETPEFH